MAPDIIPTILDRVKPWAPKFLVELPPALIVNPVPLDMSLTLNAPPPSRFKDGATTLPYEGALNSTKLSMAEVPISNRWTPAVANDKEFAPDLYTPVSESTLNVNAGAAAVPDAFRIGTSATIPVLRISSLRVPPVVIETLSAPPLYIPVSGSALKDNPGSDAVPDAPSTGEPSVRESAIVLENEIVPLVDTCSKDVTDPGKAVGNVSE
jgi:hypothetical protein